MKTPKPIPFLVKPLIKSAKEIVDSWEEKFPDYEIESIVADLELNLPKSLKGSLKVTMKKKNTEQNMEVMVEPQEPMKITK